MAGSEITIASISNQKLESVAQKAEVAVFKKALNQQAEVTKQLVDSATPAQPPPGTGKKLNTVA